jgi:hypothetical protein
MAWVGPAITAGAGLLGSRKGGSDRQEVTPQQQPSIPPELQDALSKFGEMLSGYMTPENLKSSMPAPEDIDFGPSSLGAEGEDAMARLKAGGKPIYDTTSEEASAASYLGDLLSGKSSDMMRGKLGDYESAAQATADRQMRQQTEAVRGKYAGSGLYSSAPMAESANVAGALAESLAQGKAERGLGLEQFLQNIGLQAAPMMANIGEARGQRAIQAGQLNQSSIEALLDALGLNANLATNVAGKRYGESVRQSELPYDRLSTFANILGGFNAGESYWPQTEPSEFAQTLSGFSNAWPSIWEAYEDYRGSRKNRNTGTGTARTVPSTPADSHG